MYGCSSLRNFDVILSDDGYDRSSGKVLASLEGVDDAVKEIILVKNKEISDAAKKLGG